MFVIEGARGVRSALEAGASLETVYVDEAAALRVGTILAAARDAQVPVTTLAPGVIERISDTSTPQPVLGVAAARTVDLTEIDTSLVLVLGQVGEPGNAGTLVRSAQAAGASAVVFCSGSVDAFSPKVVRAAAGALHRIPIVQGHEVREVLEVLARRGVRRFGTSAGTGVRYDRVDWAAPTAVVLGNEAHGLPTHVASLVDAWLTIPMAAGSDSLNVAMAGTLLLYEARRYREARDDRTSGGTEPRE